MQAAGARRHGAAEENVGLMRRWAVAVVAPSRTLARGGVGASYSWTGSGAELPIGVRTVVLRE